MTSVAARLLHDFETLAPEEQLLVRERVISLTESIQRKALERLRGASEGKELLTKLLEDRAGERARGR
jgi:hypothetical protein